MTEVRPLIAGNWKMNGLAASLDGARHCEQPDDRFARADIALQEAQHALGAGEVRVDLDQSLFL